MRTKIGLKKRGDRSSGIAVFARYSQASGFSTRIQGKLQEIIVR